MFTGGVGYDPKSTAGSQSLVTLIPLHAASATMVTNSAAFFTMASLFYHALVVAVAQVLRFDESTRADGS